MRQTLAVTLLFASVSSCASGGITPRAREVQSLRREVDALEARAEALEAELASSRQAQAESLDAREDALRVELHALQAEVTSLLAALEQARDEAAEAEESEGGEAKAAGAPAAPVARSRPSRAKAEAEDPSEPIADPADRVRALMADVAARLQVASESVGDDQQSAARLARARQLLVEADRTAAKKQFEEAETLAQDAAEVIADTLTRVETAQP